MSVGDILILCAVGAWLLWAVLSRLRGKKGGCCGDCSRCGGCARRK